MKAWIATCHLQRSAMDNIVDEVEDCTCLAAVWADGYDTFRARLIAHLQTTPYRLLWIEECHEALEFVSRHGQQAGVGALARMVHSGHHAELGPVSAKGAASLAQAPLPSFVDALMGLDAKTLPVFAVLDGAQFDNLPKALFDGDFIAKPLYLDRGENDPEQIVTAPHMVWLDEEAEDAQKRSYTETVQALFEVIDDKPAAVFWQCPGGGDALYRHLRSINMVSYPKAAFSDWEELEVPESEGPKTPDTHTMVLFRHADANVMAQMLSAMTAEELARFYGPAAALLFQPSLEWRGEQDWLKRSRPDNLPAAPRGALRLCMETVERMGVVRMTRSHKRIVAYLRSVAPEQTQDIDDKGLLADVVKYTSEAQKFGVRREASLGRWCYLQLMSGGAISKSPEVIDLMQVEDPGVTPDMRVDTLLKLARDLVAEGRSL